MIFVNDVAAGIFMDSWRTRLHGGFRVDDRRQLLVIHRDHVDRVFSKVAIVRHYDGQRLAKIANLIDRQRIKLHRPQHRAAADAQWFYMLRDVFSGKHRAHTGRGPRRFDVDRFDSRVRAGAAHERHVQGSRGQQIIDEAPGAGHKAQRFF